MKRSVQLAGVWIVSAIVIGAAAPATAQTLRTPSVDASIGYQILHLPDETFPVGWNADVSGALNDMWRIVGEFGMSVDDQNEPGVSGNLKYYHLASAHASSPGRELSSRSPSSSAVSPTRAPTWSLRTAGRSATTIGRSCSSPAWASASQPATSSA